MQLETKKKWIIFFFSFLKLFFMLWIVFAVSTCVFAFLKVNFPTLNFGIPISNPLSLFATGFLLTSIGIIIFLNIDSSSQKALVNIENEEHGIESKNKNAVYESFNSSVFEIQLGNKIQWFPLENESLVYFTPLLDQKNEYKIVYKYRTSTIIIGILFFLFTTSILLFFLIGYLDIKNIVTNYIVGCSSFFFFILSFLNLNKLTEKKIFDLQKGYFWKKFFFSTGNQYKKTRIFIFDILGIQILPKMCEHHCCETGITTRGPNYELNLVCSNGNRQFLFQFPDIPLARETAEKLGCFLNKPVWDAIDYINILD